MLNIYSYFTVWSLIISYSIFIWSIFIKIPKWIFLLGACILTMTSIMGTFFLTIPGAQHRSNLKDTTPKQIILEDSFIHSGPLIIFLILFYFLKQRVLVTTKLKKQDINLDFKKSFFTLLLLTFLYFYSINYQNAYDTYDSYSLVLLSGCVFLSSYQIYDNVIKE